jgi:hypothetical protein
MKKLTFKQINDNFINTSASNPQTSLGGIVKNLIRAIVDSINESIEPPANTNEHIHISPVKYQCSHCESNCIITMEDAGAMKETPCQWVFGGDVKWKEVKDE